MRNSEWINLVFFSAFIIVSLFRSIENTKGRIKAIATGISGIILILAAQSLKSFVPLNIASTIRDWLPAPLMLFAYWQAGNLIRTPNEKLQNTLVNFDRKVFGYFLSFRYPTWLESYFEFAYLFCYPLVPGGLAILYLLQLAELSDIFWTAVLSPTYVCHALVPFTQTLPPWMLEPEKVQSKQTNLIRALNFWIIKKASIHANTLPSAHVASSLAVSLILLRFAPLAGFIFFWISISIAIATITGRYHYTLDVITAMILVIITIMFLRIWI
jgi:PAP2 superfamily